MLPLPNTPADLLRGHQSQRDPAPVRGVHPAVDKKAVSVDIASIVDQPACHARASFSRAMI
ncbi:hypothetical protein SDC9_187440 [bioreactor metagenome]|uniref:Uncharacterized protein n=1 Tax=bioreactor metagenome TaxID=1076179 RepID=A0A645HMW3_9ZZZZ